MKKELKDYLHLYLGCEVKISSQNAAFDTDVLDADLLARLHDDLPIEYYKPLLRPLSDISVSESKLLWEFVFKRDFQDNGNYRVFEGGTDRGRIVLMSGVERLGVEFNGKVWADSDMEIFNYNKHEVTVWLLSKHFDLFGLIESGLAISKPTLQKG